MSVSDMALVVSISASCEEGSLPQLPLCRGTAKRWRGSGERLGRSRRDGRSVDSLVERFDIETYSDLSAE